MVQLLLRYSRGPIEAKNALYKCLKHFPKAPNRVAAIIGSLLHHAPYDQLNQIKDDHGQRLLHLLVSLSKAAPEVAEPLLIRLVQQGALLNVLNSDSHIPWTLPFKRRTNESPFD